MKGCEKKQGHDDGIRCDFARPDRVFFDPVFLLVGWADAGSPTPKAVEVGFRGVFWLLKSVGLASPTYGLIFI
jgi:hypothetical protein